MTVYPSDNNDKAIVARSVLEDYVKNYKIFIDTCSLLDDKADLFWGNILPLLSRHNVKVIVPHRCIQEVQRHQTNTKDPDLAQKAKKCMGTIQRLIKDGYLEVRGEPSDNFADNVFLVVFSKFRMNHRLLLITQDKALSEDILGLNNTKSVSRAHTIHAKKINKYGFLSDAVFKSNGSTPDVGKPQPSSSSVSVSDEEKFEICTKVTDITDTKMTLTHLPAANESVYVYTNQWLSISLLDELGSGGEASIYTTNTPYVAKIYKKDTNTKRKYEKIKLMLSKKIEYPGICYPVAPIYNKNKEFIGYLMPRAKGKELQRGIFLVKSLFQKNFPTWKKRDTVELCITILEKIKYLHDRNIIMGDINPSNILVVSPKEVYFVDTDSYQVGPFPCPVGTINYTAPEIQRKHFGSFLRTLGNENFAVATLLFMIMLPGKPPYSQQGGEDPIANIINMDFSYPFGESSNKKTPDGPWRYIWSHLTYDLKEAFYTTFRKGEAHSTETSRLSVEEWLSLFRYYLHLLDSGKFGQQDKMSEELYPTRHKKNANFTYVTCSLCNKEVPEQQSKNGICQTCLDAGETYPCSKCGKDIFYSNYQKHIKQGKRYSVCSDCYDRGNQVHSRLICTDCGRSFEITNNDHDFYVSKGFELPKRCKSCRNNKSTAPQSSYVPFSYTPRPSTPKPATPKPATPKPATPKQPPSTSSKKQSLCFITTAVCNYYGKADDCPELTTLRWYRDNWLRNQPDGPALIAEYYATAPAIVMALESSAYYSEYCEKLWSAYIVPCLDLISQQSYEECKQLYTAMFHYIKSELSL